MERYLEKGRSSSRTQQCKTEAAPQLLASPSTKMAANRRNATAQVKEQQQPQVQLHTQSKKAAAAGDMSQAPQSPQPSPQSPQQLRPIQLTKEDYSNIAGGVAKLIKPMIQEAVAEAIKEELNKIRTDVSALETKVAEAELRISELEDEHAFGHNKVQQMEQAMASMAEKLDDLENRARRNNLRIVGLPESIKTAEIYRICQIEIPKALG